MNKKSLICYGSTISAIIGGALIIYGKFGPASPSNSPLQSTTTNQTVVINNPPIISPMPTPAPAHVSLSAIPIKQPSNKQLETASQQMKPQKLKTPIKVILNCKTGQKVRIQRNFYVWCNGFSAFGKRWMREIHTNFIDKNLIFDQNDYDNNQLVYFDNTPYRFSVLKTKNYTEANLKIDQIKR